MSIITRAKRNERQFRALTDLSKAEFDRLLPVFA